MVLQRARVRSAATGTCATRPTPSCAVRLCFPCAPACVLRSSFRCMSPALSPPARSAVPRALRYVFYVLERLGSSYALRRVPRDPATYLNTAHSKARIVTSVRGVRCAWRATSSRSAGLSTNALHSVAPTGLFRARVSPAADSTRCTIFLAGATPPCALHPTPHRVSERSTPSLISTADIPATGLRRSSTPRPMLCPMPC